MIEVLINSLSGGALNLLIAISFWLVFAPTKTFYISHAAAITFGAYGCYWMIHTCGIPAFASAILSCLAVGGLFCLGEKLVLRRVRNSGHTWNGLVSSLGLYVVLQSVVSLCFGDETRVLRANPVNASFRVGSAYIAQGQLMIIGASVALTIVLILLLRYSRLGRQIHGVSSNPDLCVLLGTEPDRVAMKAVTLGSMLAALSGILAGFDADISPTMGFRLFLGGIVVMIVGGGEGIGGFAAGALLLAVAQHSAAYYLDAKWMDATAFMFLIAFLIWRPRGFTQGRQRKVEV